MKNPDALRLAAVQLNSQNDVKRNLADVHGLVTKAAEQGAKLAVLPENFAYFGADAGRCEIAERLGDSSAPIQGALSGLAKSARLTLVAGGFPERSDDPERPFNTCAVFSPDGELVASYRKVHLFDVELPDGSKLCESAHTSAGSAPVVVEVEGFKVGLSICYDLRFPELYRALVSLGAEVLLVPASFTLLTGKDHWHVLLRARAIESQCWVVAAGQWGKHPRERTTYGHSLIADPWGAVIAECSDHVGFALAEVQRPYLEQVRSRLPCLEHRRL
jgi:predicted amidohydrolase